MITRLLSLVTLVAVSTSSALAQFDSGSDGSDRALDCAALFALNPLCASDCLTACTVEIDLSLAASLCDCDGDTQVDDPCRWDCPSPAVGQGVYDAAQWAIVYKYLSIDIPFGVTVTFRNHPSGAPVVWLATEDVRIGAPGTLLAINISGSGGTTLRYAEPGPGGFAGGAGFTSTGVSQLKGSGGFGPGGAERGPSDSNGGGGAGYSSSGNSGTGTEGGVGGRPYGRPSIIPLIGGSGGGGSELVNSGGGGGAGGGAILIASSGNIELAGTRAIRANGGPPVGRGGAGSGGAIRLIANTIFGPGLLSAVGSSGSGGIGRSSVGRIRLEAFSIGFDVDAGNPLYTATDPGPVFPPVDTPTLRAVMVDSEPISPDPRAGVQTVDAEVLTNNTVTLKIEATNIPIGTIVDVRVTPATDASFTVQSTPLAGTLSFSTATAQFDPSLGTGLPPGTSDIVLRAEPTP